MEGSKRWLRLLPSMQGAEQEVSDNRQAKMRRDGQSMIAHK